MILARAAAIVALASVGIAASAFDASFGDTPPALSSGLPLDTLDRSVRPQDDLYRFVNGRWLQSASVPPDRVSYGTFTELADRIEEDIRIVIEKTAAGGKRGGDTQRVVDLYASLMDEDAAERHGSEPVRSELARIDAVQSRQALAAQMGRLAATGGGSAFAASVELDALDRRRLAVRLAQGGTMLPDREHYVSDAPEAIELRADYERYLARIFMLTGRRDPEGAARAVLALETALARAQSPNTYAREGPRTPRRITLAQLASEMPGFDWMAWARPQGIDRAAALVFDHPAFFTAFASLAASEPLEAWQAWLAARYITASAPFLDRALGDARFDFFGRRLTGQQEPRARWRRGVSLVNSYLGDVVGRLYVKDHFSPAAKPRMRAIVRNIIEAYKRAIRRAGGMASAAKMSALDRLAAMRTRLGHPDTWRSYGGLEIKRDDLVGNIQRAQNFESAQRLRHLRGAQDGEWAMTPQTVNAYYAPALNEIVVPASMLQPPLFQLDAEDAVNYGAIGAIVAHEIAHGLEEEAGFQYRALMLVPQFSGYSPVPGLRVDGGLTFRENLADLVGLSIAHAAYRLSLDGGAGPVIDGFTGDQRFFISWARVWRNLERDDYVRQSLSSSPYAPFEYRANGIVSNMPAFFEAFDVRPGDRLFRDQNARAKVW